MKEYRWFLIYLVLNNVFYIVVFVFLVKLRGYKGIVILEFREGFREDRVNCGLE